VKTLKTEKAHAKENRSMWIAHPQSCLKSEIKNKLAFYYRFSGFIVIGKLFLGL